MATEMSWISLLANNWSGWVSNEFNTLPRKGKIAWVALSRASFAEPPAESPSTKNNSFSRMSSLSQSVSLPGKTATPEPLRFSIFFTERWRACACLIASSAMRLPISVSWFNANSIASTETVDTNRSASRLVNLSLVWPWNCGSSTRADKTNADLANTSSDCSFTPRGSRL